MAESIPQPAAPVRVVHLITDLDTGGAEMMLYKVLSRMNRQRFQNVVVSLTDRGTLAGRIEQLGIPVHTLGMPPGLPAPLGLWRLLALLRRVRPDILQTWLYHADLMGLVAGRLAGMPAILWNIRCSDMDMSRYSRMSALVVRLLAWSSAQPDLVLVNSQAGRRRHEAIGYHPRRWLFIPNGFELDRFRPDPSARPRLRRELSLPDDALLIGMVARYDPMKDHHTFLRAARRLLDRWPDVHFALVGRDMSHDNPDLARLINSLDLHPNIHLLGERQDVPAITPALDIASLSSTSEGFSNVIGEAIDCGVPCVVTDVGDSAYVVGDTGVVVPSRDPEAMAQGWAKLLEMPARKRRALGMAARNRIQELFSIEQIATPAATPDTARPQREETAGKGGGAFGVTPRVCSESCSTRFSSWSTVTTKCRRSKDGVIRYRTAEFSPATSAVLRRRTSSSQTRRRVGRR